MFFLLTPAQQQILSESFSYLLKICYGFVAWSDHFFSLAGKYTLLDRLFRYWTRLEVALTLGPDTLSLAHQWIFYRSFRDDLRVQTLHDANVRLNQRQIRLFPSRYVHVFELWFSFWFFYHPSFAYYHRASGHLTPDLVNFFLCWSTFSST